MKSTRADLKESYSRGWKDKMKGTCQTREQTEKTRDQKKNRELGDSSRRFNVQTIGVPETGNRRKQTRVSSVQFSRSVMSNSLQPHGLQHARPLCSSPTPGDYSNSCPLSQDTIQPSHPLSSASPLALNLTQHQGLFQ